MLKKGLKYLMIALSGFLILIVLFLILTQTSWFRRVLKDQVVKIAALHLNGELEIGRMDGNFYNYLELADVSLMGKDSTIASFSSLKLNYNLWALSKKQILIDTIELANPSFFLAQESDSSWNFQQLLPPAKKKRSKKIIVFPFRVDVNYLAITNGTLVSSTFIDLIPTSINNINLMLGGAYSRSRAIQAHLKNLNFQMLNPAIELNELSTLFKWDDSGIAIDSFTLRTAGSNLFGNGEIESIEKLNANIESAPLDKKELALFIPSFKLAHSPEIKSFFNAQNDSIEARIELVNGDQSMTVGANLYSFAKALKGENVKVPYQANIVMHGVSPEDWIEMKNSNSTVNGEMTLKGSNLLDFKSAINVNANLNNSVYHGNEFNTLRIKGTYENDNVETEFAVESPRGKALVKANILKVSSKLPEYNFTLLADSFNLTSVLPKVKGTFINANIEAKGSGFKASDLNIDANLDLLNSTIYNIPLDSANLSARLINDDIFLDTLNAIVPGGEVNGSGSFKISSLYLAAQADLSLDSLRFLSHYVTLPIEFSSLISNAKIEGPVSKLEFSGDVKLDEVEGYSIKSEILKGDLSGVIIKDSLLTHAKISAENLLSGSILWDTISTDLKYQKKQIDALINASWNDTLDAKVKTKIQLGDSIHVALPVFEIKTILSDFYLQDTLQTIELNTSSVAFNNIWIKDYNQPDFNLKINGDLGFNGPENIEITVEQLNLNELNKIILLKDSIRGLLSTSLKVSGNSNNPVFEGNMDIENPGYGLIQLSKFTGNLDYRDKNAKVNFSLPDLGSNGFAQAPMEISYDSTRFNFKLPETFEAGIKIDSLQVSQSFSDMLTGMDVYGNLNIDIKADGTLKTPMFYGHLKINEGRFIDRKFGISYNDINTNLRIEGQKIVFDTLLIKQEKGFLSASGEVAFDSTIISGKVANSTLVVDATNFNVVSNKDFKLQIDANSFLKMGKDYPEFGGNVNVISSEIFLPALLSDEDSKGENDVPLLLEALADPNDSILINAVEAEVSESEKIRSEFRKNLTGRMKIIIPRNTWIKSDEMNLELRGDLDLVKTGPFFELFGDVSVNRGHYMLYGRKLALQESEIIFQGGVDFDPTLNIVAEYTYRDTNKSKRILKLIITGLLSDPIINFTLDDNQMTESEAVTVLIFGKTPDEMDSDNQNGLVGSVGSNMVAQVLTSQLNKTLGSTLNLDMIEITATENWQSAAFVVGKYITNDLFITYQRGFGETDGDEITPETLTLEYELNRIFFLHLQSGSANTSGLDVILKFEQRLKN